MMIASISATAHIAAATNFAATATDGQLPFLDANGTPIPTRPEYVGGKYRDVPVGGTVEYIGGEYHVVPPGGNVEYIGGEYRVIPVDGNVEYIGGEYRTIPADGNVEYIGGEYRVVPAGMKYITSEESTGSFLPDVHRRWSP